MVRDLIDDWKRLRRRILRRTERRTTASATLVCAEMIGDVLNDIVEEWKHATGARADLAVLKNSFFGPRVRVSGLLTGGDIVANAGRYAGDIVILPSVMLDKSGTRTIDGMSPAEISARLGKPVYFAGYLSEVDRIVFDTVAHLAA